MKELIILFEGVKKIREDNVPGRFEQIISYLLLKLNGVVIGNGFKSRRVPIVDV
jgi:hypothetical protein